MKKLLINHFISLSIKGFAVVGSFLLAKVYIDKISKEEFGLFTLTYGYVVLFATIIGTGPGLLVIAKSKNKDKIIKPAIFVIINIFIGVFIWLFINLFYKIEVSILLAICFTAICYYMNETMRLNSSGNIYIFFKDIVRSVLCILLIYIHVDNVNNILLYSSILNLASILFFVLLMKRDIYFSLDLRKITLKEYWASLSISLSSGLQIAKGWIEIFLSGMFLSLSDVGLFSILQRLAKLISLPLNALNADIGKSAVISIAQKKVSTKLKQQLKLTRLTSIVFTVICLVILGYFLKIYDYDRSFLNYFVGVVLILTNLANVIFGPVGLFTQLSNLRDAYLYSTIVSIVLTFIFSWIFLPLYGIFALSIINLITMIAWNWWLHYKIRKSTNIFL
ncbi:MAG: hypothetical protein R2760_06785 [Chitinophagales bacterium]